MVGLVQQLQDASTGQERHRTKSAIRGQVGWCGHSAVLRRPERRELPINPGTDQRCRFSGLPSAPPPTPRAATRSTLYRCLTTEYRYRSCSSHQNGSTSSNIYKHRLVKVYRKLLIWSKYPLLVLLLEHDGLFSSLI